MEVKLSKFISSISNINDCPNPDKPEFAFIGRSNVGKSSLINTITNNKNLAKTSSKPGKTQTINHFLINNSWYLVDLPGYGYITPNVKLKEKWQNFTRNYLRNRENLNCVFVLIDIRHELQKIDDEFIIWLGINQIPFSIIFTKADKLKEKDIDVNVRKITDKLLDNWEELPPYFITSSEIKYGISELLDYIEKIINS